MSKDDDIDSGLNALQIAQFVTGVVPVPGIGMVSLGMSGAEGHLLGQKQLKALIAKTPGAHSIADLEGMAPSNPIIQRELDEIRGSIADSLGNAAVGVAGASAGAAIGTAVVPIPLLGSLGGAVVGSVISTMALNKVTTEHQQEAWNIASDLNAKRANGQKIEPEEVFLAMAANLPDDKRKLVEAEVFSIAGTHDFRKALEETDPKKFTSLMMTSDENIRGVKGVLMHNLKNPRTLAEEYADILNASPNTDAAIALPNAADIPMLMKMLQKAQADIKAANVDDVAGRTGFGSASPLPNLRPRTLGK